MKRPGDTTPAPRGGRAAARLRMFERARKGTTAVPAVEPPAPEPACAPSPPQRKPRTRRRSREESDR